MPPPWGGWAAGAWQALGGGRVFALEEKGRPRQTLARDPYLFEPRGLLRPLRLDPDLQRELHRRPSRCPQAPPRGGQGLLLLLLAVPGVPGLGGAAFRGGEGAEKGLGRRGWGFGRRWARQEVHPTLALPGPGSPHQAAPRRRRLGRALGRDLPATAAAGVGAFHRGGHLGAAQTIGGQVEAAPLRGGGALGLEHGQPQGGDPAQSVPAVVRLVNAEAEAHRLERGRDVLPLEALPPERLLRLAHHLGGLLRLGAPDWPEGLARAQVDQVGHHEGRHDARPAEEPPLRVSEDQVPHLDHAHGHAREAREVQGPPKVGGRVREVGVHVVVLGLGLTQLPKLVQVALRGEHPLEVGEGDRVRLHHLALRGDRLEAPKPQAEEAQHVDPAADRDAAHVPRFLVPRHEHLPRRRPADHHVELGALLVLDADDFVPLEGDRPQARYEARPECFAHLGEERLGPHQFRHQKLGNLPAQCGAELAEDLGLVDRGLVRVEVAEVTPDPPSQRPRETAHRHEGGHRIELFSGLARVHVHRRDHRGDLGDDHCEDHRTDKLQHHHVKPFLVVPA
mmetsp:Transcript_51052/g.116073  ORF Transcript_51052/g.116073 Transcript_51052/m.116073 type:complete len:564 (+) Transcript_51052:520-2211(+)